MKRGLILHVALLLVPLSVLPVPVRRYRQS